MAETIRKTFQTPVVVIFSYCLVPVSSCHCLDYRDTILALKASGVSNSTMFGASRFQSRTVLGKNDIFLVSIREEGIWRQCREERLDM
jgi:hypothetical protein